jgi:pyroglutamyl-peptidase
MLERRAKNFLDKPYPRNSFQPCVIEEGAPSFLQSSFQHFEILERDLQSAKIPTCFSDDAGGSLCNQVYYHALNYSQSNSLQIQSTFVHLPLLPEQVKEQFFNKPFMTLETMRESFVIMVRAICTAKSSLQ